MHHISCRVFWWNSKSPRWLSPLQSRFGTLWLLAFPKTKITFEREEISDYWWDSIGKYDGTADGDWEKCVRPQRCLLWSGLRHHCPMYNVSYILYLLQQMSLFFIVHGWILSEQTCYTGLWQSLLSHDWLININMMLTNWYSSETSFLSCRLNLTCLADSFSWMSHRLKLHIQVQNHNQEHFPP